MLMNSTDIVSAQMLISKLHITALKLSNNNGINFSNDFRKLIDYDNLTNFEQELADFYILGYMRGYIQSIENHE
jgi:hypothetical protein